MDNTPLAAALLRRALQSFSAGNIDAARAACRDALRARPDHPGALHLLGVIAHNSGDRSEAQALLRRAAESPGTTAVYLLSYAELCCKPTDLDGAVDAARRAVALDAGLPLGWLCLGRLLFEMRQYEESRTCFERALELDPNFWQARSGLANVLGRLGNVEEAIGLSEALLREQPDYAEAHDSFAALLQDLGRYHEALAQAELAAGQRPDSIDFQLRAADIELQLGRYWPALARLGVIEKTGQGDVKLLTLKAHLLRLVDRFDEAAELCRHAVSQGAESAELLRAYGLALQLTGQETEALTVFDRAAAAQCATALSDKGVLLTQLGRLAEACETFGQALVQEPTLADAWYNKSSAKRRTADDPDIAAMERLLGGHCSSRDRLLLHFALGKSHMDTGNADAAFFHWHAANRMKRAIIDYDADAVARTMKAIAAQPLVFDAADAATASRLCELPVFVVGMPRSGSSLVEQILASHPEAHGAGELTQLRGLFETAVPGTESAVAEAAIAKLQRFATRARRIIDKDLANFLHLGLIHRIFPRARIIHCRRDPLDTCFSAYTKLFVGDLRFTYDLRELGRYYRDYHALMKHWRLALPSEAFLEIDYETLVAEPESETRRLLDFVGLAWNDACIRFFETERAVRTASVADVRRPIYRSSVGRARSLQSHLQPLIDALGDLGLRRLHV